MNAYVEDRLISSGSGTVYSVATDKSVYIVTNEHVISKAEIIEVFFANGEKMQAELVGSDLFSDLALLKVTPAFKVEALEQGDSSLCKKGEWVIAIGNPLGNEFQGTTSVGVISGKDRNVPVDLNDDGVDDWDMVVLQTDAAINPGNSGGPLINLDGQLIGITSMKISSDSVEGMGFAIPINEVVPIIEQLKATGVVNRPVMGVSGQDVSELTSYQKSYLGINLDRTEGLLVTRVLENTPAEKAGFQTGDILVGFDGSVVDSFKAFRKLLYGKNVGDTIEVTLVRAGKEIKLSVKLA